MNDARHPIEDSPPAVPALLGHVCVVTGGGSGIGRVICQALARSGARLAVVGRRMDALNETVEMLQSETGRDDVAVAIQGDVTSQNDVERVAGSVAAQFGPVDVLVNCAATQGPIGPFVAGDIGAWARTIETDLVGPARMARAFLPGMIHNGGGCIINMSGGGATGPRPSFSAYSAAKAGLVRFTETLAVEGRPAGIRVYAIAPGAINTAMLDEVIQAGDAAGDERAAALERHAAGGDSTKPVAALVTYLASGRDGGSLSGKLLAAQHDDWWALAELADVVRDSDWLALRRVDPATIRRLPPLDRGRS